GVQDYIRSTRPHRDISDKLDLPLIQLIAEGDYVMTSFVRPEKDAAGETYYSTWFDLYRIEDGKIAEHWDPMLKSDPKIDPNTKKHSPMMGYTLHELFLLLCLMLAFMHFMQMGAITFARDAGDDLAAGVAQFSFLVTGAIGVVALGFRGL